MTTNRRNFLASALTAGSVPFASTALGSLLLSQAAAAQTRDITGYKALVCVFLAGGNDSFNTVIPRDNNYYGLYATARAGVGTGLAIAQNTVLPINSVRPQSSGAQYGLHPAMPELQQLYASNRCAIVANVGPLIEPITQAQFQNGSVRCRRSCLVTRINKRSGKPRALIPLRALVGVDGWRICCKRAIPTAAYQ
jgi:uncharacterized protein (DUF1501 family)